MNWDGGVQWATPIDLGRSDGGTLQATQRTLSREGLRTGSSEVPSNSLILSSRAPIGYVVDTEKPSAFNQGCKGLAAIADLDVRFYRYVLSSSKAALTAVGQGSTFVELSSEALASFRVPHPLVTDQRAIADYLDTETARIDALIAKKRILRTRLSERYESRRSETLLRGIDPVDGSGAAPNGWRVGSLATVARLQRGLDLPDSARRPGHVPIVSSGGRSGWHDVVGIRGPGVITGRYGTVGTVYWEPNDFWPLNTTLYVRDFGGNDPRWVYHLLAAVPLDLDSAKSAVTGINRNVVGQLRVPIPPLEEQQRLAIQLDADAERCSQTVAALDQQLALIREHRQALITAAVTGELEIPGVAS